MPLTQQIAQTQPTLAALFHQLACDPAWFRQRALPIVRVWAAYSCWLEGVAAAEQAFSLEHWLTQAAAALVRCTSAEPAQRLQHAHRAVMDLWWQRNRRVCWSDAQGQCWSPGPRSWPDWRAVSLPPHRLACSAGIITDLCGPALDPWCTAAGELVRRGLWQPDQRCGRWWQDSGGWHLLWPLGGRDLLHTRAIAELRLGSVPDALPAAVQGLQDWGHLVPDLSGAAQATPQECPRADGRTLLALRVRRPLFGAQIG